MSALQIVWFKRDLRTVDHRPLMEAIKRGPVLPLYVVEPELWQQPDTSERQWLFCQESLLDLQRALAEFGQPLVVRSGDVVDVLEHELRALAKAHVGTLLGRESLHWLSDASASHGTLENATRRPPHRVRILFRA